MSAQFEGSAEQRRILKLREVEEPLERIRIVSQLMIHSAHDEDMDAVKLINDAAQEALDRLGEVEH